VATCDLDIDKAIGSFLPKKPRKESFIYIAKNSIQAEMAIFHAKGGNRIFRYTPYSLHDDIITVGIPEKNRHTYQQLR